MAARTVEQQWNLLSSAVDTAERAKKALRRTVTSTHMATASGYTVRNLLVHNLLVQNELGKTIERRFQQLLLDILM